MAAMAVDPGRHEAHLADRPAVIPRLDPHQHERPLLCLLPTAPRLLVAEKVAQPVEHHGVVEALDRLQHVSVVADDQVDERGL